MATTKKETKEVTTTTNQKGEKKMLVERVDGKKVYWSEVLKNAELMKKFTASNLAENCENIIFNGTASKPKFREALSSEAVKVKFDEWCVAHPAKQRKESTGTRRSALEIIKEKFLKAIEALPELEKAELVGSLDTILSNAKTKLEAIKKQKKNSIVAKVKKMNAEELEALKKAIAEAEAVSVTNN